MEECQASAVVFWHESRTAGRLMTRRRVRLAAGLLGMGVLCTTGCSTTRRVTNSPATALQQLLGTESVDRALAAAEWPDLSGRRLYVRTGSPSDRGEQASPQGELGEWQGGNEGYLRAAVEAKLAERGAIIVPRQSDAEFMAIALAGAIGTDAKDVFLGIPPVTSVVLPFSTPEIALYKAQDQEGFAKTEIVIVDLKRGGVAHHAGPTRGRTYAHNRQILFFGWYTTDTSRREQ